MELLNVSFSVVQSRFGYAQKRSVGSVPLFVGWSVQCLSLCLLQRLFQVGPSVKSGRVRNERHAENGSVSAVD